MKYKIAYTGYEVALVDAGSEDEARELFYDEGLNDLYNAEIVEVVPADEAFVFHTDLND